MSDEIKADLNIIPVRWIDEVLEIALAKLPNIQNDNKSDITAVATSSEKPQNKPAPKH